MSKKNSQKVVFEYKCPIHSESMIHWELNSIWIVNGNDGKRIYVDNYDDFTFDFHGKIR